MKHRQRALQEQQMQLKVSILVCRHFSLPSSNTEHFHAADRNKKFELMLMRRAKAYSSSDSVV